MTKKTVALKPKLVSHEEIIQLRKKYSLLRTTVSTYETKGRANVCTLYTFWQGQEKVAQMHDYGYGIVFKSFIDNMYYTDYAPWLEK